MYVGMLFNLFSVVSCHIKLQGAPVYTWNFCYISVCAFFNYRGNKYYLLNIIYFKVWEMD